MVSFSWPCQDHLVRISLVSSLQRSKTPPNNKCPRCDTKSCDGIILLHAREPLRNVEYYFIVITPRSTDLYWY